MLEWFAKRFIIIYYLLLKMFKHIYYFILALRPKQRIKNIVVFIPLLFSHLFMNPNSILRVFIIFIVFSVFIGCTYVFNDYKDLEKDKNHPHKKNRPLVSWKLNKKFALILSSVFLIGSLLFSFFFWWSIVWILFIIYLINTILYTLCFKHIVIVDVFSIALGFVIRWLIWTFIINVEISPRFLTILFFWALWFWFLKRYQEVMLSSDIRVNIDKYNESFLEQVISIVTWIVIISYALYTFNSVQTKLMVITIPFLSFIIIRYYYNIFYLKKYEDSIETIILQDKSIVICSILLFILILALLCVNNIQ